MPVWKFLALFGFARRDVQAGIPPYFALLGLVAAGYFGGVIVEVIVWASQVHWAVGAAVRAVGVTASLLAFHSAWRAIIHGD